MNRPSLRLVLCWALHPLYKPGFITYAESMDPLERKELQEMRTFDAKEFLAALERADGGPTRSTQPYMEFLRWVQRQKPDLKFEPCCELPAAKHVWRGHPVDSKTVGGKIPGKVRHKGGAG